MQAYLAVWVAGTPDYDHLFTRSNLEGAVVGLALSLAMSVGAKKRGADDDASLLDPPEDKELVARLRGGLPIPDDIPSSGSPDQ